MGFETFEMWMVRQAIDGILLNAPAYWRVLQPPITVVSLMVVSAYSFGAWGFPSPARRLLSALAWWQYLAIAVAIGYAAAAEGMDWPMLSADDRQGRYTAAILTGCFSTVATLKFIEIWAPAVSSLLIWASRLAWCRLRASAVSVAGAER